MGGVIWGVAVAVPHLAAQTVGGAVCGRVRSAAQQAPHVHIALRRCGKVGVALNLSRRCVSKFALRLP